MRGDERGTTAIEFAIVGPIFIFLVIGIAFFCMGLAVAGSMHYAVEEGARCASVKPACQIAGVADATLTQTYTQNHYFGPSVSPTFTYAAAACGNSVSASISYSMNVGFRTFTVPISATSCFP